MSVTLRAIEKTISYSEESIEKLRKDLKQALPNSDVLVVTVGSFARREASKQSDLDFFVICEDDDENSEKDYETVIEIFNKSDIIMPSLDGAFAQLEKSEIMLNNIGGNDDSTERLTRRMLFLFECEWLFNENKFKKLFNDIINRYVQESITQHQLCRFLLNDLIRYYRTICVDFEYKTVEKGKTWGDRNIKLLFSRKLLYFSGLLVIAETVQHTCITKRKILIENLGLTPIDRIKKLCGSNADRALYYYNEFIEELSKSSVRNILNKTCKDRDAQLEEFRNLKNKGHHFSWEISRLLGETYDESHPIHHAIKF